MKRSYFYNLDKASFGVCSPTKLYSSVKDNLQIVQRLQCVHNAKIHNGCVNTISWNEEGRLVLSGSDDLHLVISNPFTRQTIFKNKTYHRSNIFSAKFMPMSSDLNLISSSADGVISWMDVNKPSETILYNNHRGPAYELATIVDERDLFLSCGNDGTTRLFDLRMKSASEDNILVKCKGATLSVASNHMHSYYFVIGCSDGIVRFYDRRMIQQQTDEGGSVEKIVNANLCNKSHRITSLCYNKLATKLLVSYSAQHVYLFNLNAKNVLQNMEAVNESHSDVESELAPIRRLRLRGDWSDTGPSSRPNRHSPIHTPTEEERPISLVMQRMSQIMTNWFQMRTNQTTVQYISTDSDHSADLNQSATQNLSIDQIHVSTARQSEHLASSVDQNQIADQIQTDDENSSVSNPNQLVDNKFANKKHSAEDTQTFEINSFVNFTLSDSKNPSFEHLGFGNSLNSTQCDNKCDNLITNCDVKINSNIFYSNEFGSLNNFYADSSISTSIDQIHLSNYVGSSNANNFEVGNYTDIKSRCSTYQKNSNNKLESDYKKSDKLESFTNNNIESASILERKMQIPAISNNLDQQQSTSRAIDELESFVDNADDILNNSSSSFSSYHSANCEPDINLFNFENEDFIKCFKGHRNTRTVIKEASFWGDRFVMSGSDCGHIFIWDADTTQLVALLPADRHVVNCVQPHHEYPVLISSGIDYDVKLWMPISSQSNLDSNMAEEVIRRNRLMLEQTRDTVTVPASFIIRLFALLNRPNRTVDSSSE